MAAGIVGDVLFVAVAVANVDLLSLSVELVNEPVLVPEGVAGCLSAVNVPKSVVGTVVSALTRRG